MRMHVRAAALTAALAASVAAQSATFDVFGPGCNGTVPTRCITQNTLSPVLMPRNLTNEYAHAARNGTGGPVTVVGVEFFTSTVTATSTSARRQIAFYFDAMGVATSTPTEPALSFQSIGTIEVGQAAAWYPGWFYPPIQVPAGAFFWVSADTNGINPPDNVNGSGALATSRWRRPGFVGAGWNETTLIANPAYRILCLPAMSSLPRLVNNGVPRLGSTFSIELYDAPPIAPAAFHALGGSRTSWRGLPLPFDLTVIGAPSCMLLASIDVTFLRPVAGRHASQPIGVPNVASLAGANLYHQWVILAGPATPLGLVFSNAGVSTIGGL